MKNQDVEIGRLKHELGRFQLELRSASCDLQVANARAGKAQRRIKELEALLHVHSSTSSADVEKHRDRVAKLEAGHSDLQQQLIQVQKTLRRSQISLVEVQNEKATLEAAQKDSAEQFKVQLLEER